MTWIIGFVLAAVAALAVFIFAWWSIPFIVAAAALFVPALALSRKGAVTVERARKEPTGTPRKATGDAETANERVGQV